jgi:BirA family biotin operon repressor/biotin-[acetyl-CoA-carboxylase] ligase
LKELTREAVGNVESALARTAEVHEELSSTQERARELVRAGTPHGTLVISRVQTGGRGRLGRHWGSPPGGLWMSVVLRPEFDASMASRVTQTAAVAAAKALWELGVEARIKWPNDLLVDGRKICGLLAESSTGKAKVTTESASPTTTPNRLDYVILGIGMNANLDPEDLGVTEREVTTLRSELGRDVALAEILKVLLKNLEAELVRIEDFESVLEDWRRLNCTLGHGVRLRRAGEAVEGTAVDLNPEGALVLSTDMGMLEVFEGEIEHFRL